MKAFVEGELEATAHATTDEQILGLYKHHGQTAYHAVGTAALGPDDADVVDARLRVRSVTGLRVIDCSVFPEILSDNTNAPLMALAWRAADLILEDAASRA